MDEPYTGTKEFRAGDGHFLKAGSPHGRISSAAVPGDEENRPKMSSMAAAATRETKKMRIFGVGLSKTGTSSLAAALEELGASVR